MTCSAAANHGCRLDRADETTSSGLVEANSEDLVADPSPEQHKQDHADDQHDVRSQIWVRLAAAPQSRMQDGHDLWSARSDQSSIPDDAA